MFVWTYSTKPPLLIFTAILPHTFNFKKMSKLTTLLKSNLESSMEELVDITKDNVASVILKDKIFAILCETYDVTPTFTEITTAKGKTLIVVSNSTVQELKKALLA
jgi:hypothetical protein